MKGYYFLFLAIYSGVQLLIYGCTHRENNQKAETEIDKSLIEMICAQISETLCEDASRCNCDKVHLFPKDCRGKIRDTCKTNITDFLKNQNKDKIVYDEELFTNCLNLIKSYTRNCLLPPEPTYSLYCPILISNAKISDNCNGLLCDGGNGICNESQLCIKLPQNNEECYNGLCQKGFACNSQNICVPLLKRGEICERDSQCASGLICKDGVCDEIRRETFFSNCLYDIDCNYISKCISIEKKICVPPKDIGERCNYKEDEKCKTGLYCDAIENICKKLPSVGEKCANEILCDENSGCDIISQTCKKLPLQNEECLFNQYGDVVCSDGLVCVEGICRPLPEMNEKCGMDRKAQYICDEGLGCFFAENGDNICKKKVMTNESCSNDSNCLSTDFCDYSINKCKNRLAKDSPCNLGNECMIGLVCEFKDKESKPVCREVPKENEECFTVCDDGLQCTIYSESRKCVPPICTDIISY